MKFERISPLVHDDERRVKPLAAWLHKNSC